MTSLNLFFTALASLNPATLLDAAMILFGIPAKISECFSVRFRGIQNISSPEIRIRVGVTNPKNPDKTLLPKVRDYSFGRDVDIRHRTITSVIWINQPVGFKSGAPVPFQGPD